MAPRRGGGGGGRGGGSGLSSPWGDEVQLYGSRFSDPIARGSIIVQGICAFALLVIAIAAALIKQAGASTKKTGVSTKKTTKSTRKVFAWSLYNSSLILAITAVASDLTAFIISDSELVVQRIYLLIQPILSSFYYLAEILLLATVYWLLIFHFHASTEPQKAKPTNFMRAFKRIHILFIVILFGLWLAFLSTSIRFWVGYVKYDSDAKIGKTSIDLNLAFLVLYLCATIEVMAWAVNAFWKRKTENRNLVIFLSLIAMPLLIHSCISTAFAARTEQDIVSAVGNFVDLFFSHLGIVLAYSGILFIARPLKLAQRHQPGTQDPFQGQDCNNSPSNPQILESANGENVATNRPSWPWLGRGSHHPNENATVPQHSGGGGASSDSHSVPISPPN